MNNKVYVTPSARIEQFIANEYVAACESSEAYNFQCNAGIAQYGYERDGKHGWPGYIYKESNGISGLQRGRGNSDTYLGAFHACNITHKADTKDEFSQGYYVPYGRSGVISVDIWQGDGDLHATDKLDKTVTVPNKS